jgi:hypothetical protein
MRSIHALRACIRMKFKALGNNIIFSFYLYKSVKSAQIKKKTRACWAYFLPRCPQFLHARRATDIQPSHFSWV